MSKAAVVSCRREDQYLADLKPYKNEYEYAAYGYNVGCNKLGEYPFPMHQVRLVSSLRGLWSCRLCFGNVVFLTEMTT